MNEEVMVSVVTITYNHEKYIGQALDGIVNQKTNFKFEVIVADDHSTDETQKIISKYYDENPGMIVPVLREKNLGPRRNSLDALSRAKGKYIAICEGDDYWIDMNKLQMQVDFLEKNPDFGLVHTDNDILYDSTGKIFHSMNEKRNEFLVKCNNPLHGLLTGDYMVHTLTVMVRSEYLFRAIKSEFFHDKNNLQGDLTMWLEIVCSTKFQYFPKVTSVYRMRGGSLSRQKSMIKQIEFQESSKILRMKFARKYEVPEKVMKRVEQMYYYVILTKSYHLNDKENAESAFDKLHKKDFNSKVLYYGTKHRFLRIVIEPVRGTRALFCRISDNLKGKRD